MKKNLFYVASFAIAMLFAACSSSDDVIGNETSIKDVFGEDGTAMLRLSIAAPTQTTGSRVIGAYGDNYGEFNNGEAYEHTVETAVLVLFKGAGDDEKEYTLHSAYELKNTNWSMEDSNPQVTKTGTIVQQIEQGNLTAGESLYALVLLNKHNYFTVDGTTLKDASSTVLNGKKASEVAAMLLDESHRNFSAQSFFMSNMPYTTIGGGNAAPTGAQTKVLYPVNPSSIYENETDALAGSATTTINVERALAKVSVTSSAATFTTEDGKASQGKVLGWFIDNTNPNTYVVRHCQETINPPYAASAYGYLQYASSKQGTPTYRFVSQNPVVNVADHQGNKYYRTFWAVDQNYDTPATGLTTEAGKVVENWVMTYNPDGSLKDGRLRPVGGYYYCTENTFDIKHQSVNNTTRVVVAMQFNNGNDFYTITPGTTGEIFDAADLKDEVLSQVLNRVSASQWLFDYINGSVVTDSKSLFDVAITPDAVNGTATAEVTLKPLSTTQLKAEKTVAGATDAWNNQYDQSWVNNNINISYYKGGVCYYSALIKHFGDIETPWTGNISMDNNTGVNGVYGTSSNDYLGRYGIVRNNWYKVNITGVRTIGTSVVPPLTPDVPDDQVERYIKVDINITPWAIRYQDTKL